jgi:exodeoxyribonuclease VII small subunit
VDADDSLDEESKPAEPGSFELSLAELEAIVHDLEEGELGLAESLARYEQGVKHLKQCFELLEQAEQKIDLLTGVADDGAAQTMPFAAQDDSPPETTRRRQR